MRQPRPDEISSPAVLHLVPWANLAGVERSVLNLCLSAPERRHEVLFRDAGPACEVFRAHGVRCHVLSEIAHQDGGVSRLEAITSRAEVMHIHCMEHVPGAHELARRVGLPRVVTVRGRVALPPLDCPLICVSDEVAALQVPGAHRRVILNGVNTRLFRFRQPRRSQRPVIIRVCHPRRCAPYFMEVMRDVLGAHPEAVLWIVGEEGASDERVRYFGVRADVADLLRRADIFAYAPFPQGGGHDNCVLEAMATGLPIVVTGVAGAIESVRHLKEGILVPFGDGSALASAVRRLLVDFELRRRLGRAARRQAERAFDMALVFERYNGVYREAIRAGANPMTRASSS